MNNTQYLKPRYNQIFFQSTCETRYVKMLTRNVVVLLKHIVSDLENMNVLMDSYIEELVNREDKIRYSSIMYFIEYSISQLRIFMENRKYFNQCIKCYCYKCKTIGYSNIMENVSHVIENSQQLINILDDIERRVMKTSVNSDKVYIIRFTSFITYFIHEFKNIVSDRLY